MVKWYNWRREPADGAKIGKMVKPVGSAIYGVKLVNTAPENGKASRAIGRRAYWRYKPARAIKLENGKMVNR